MYFVERVNQGESLVNGLNWLTELPAVCWSVIMGELSPGLKGAYCTRPKAFKTGPPSCAVQSMISQLISSISHSNWHLATSRSPTATIWISKFAWCIAQTTAILRSNFRCIKLKAMDNCEIFQFKTDSGQIIYFAMDSSLCISFRRDYFNFRPWKKSLRIGQAERFLH